MKGILLQRKKKKEKNYSTLALRRLDCWDRLVQLSSWVFASQGKKDKIKIPKGLEWLFYVTVIPRTDLGRMF